MAKDSDSSSATAHSSDSVTKVEALEQIEEKGIALDMIAASDDADLDSDILGSQPIVCVGINHENVDNNFRVWNNEKAMLLEAKIEELERKINSIEVAKKNESAEKECEILLLKKKLMELETVIHSIELELSKSKNAMTISDAKVSEFVKELNVLQKKIEQVILGDVNVNGGVVDINGSSKKDEMYLKLKLGFGVGAIVVVVGGIVSVYCARRR